MSYDFMRSYNRADVELPSGFGVTLSLVRAQDCMTAGAIPVGILQEMADLVAEEALEEAKTNGQKPKARKTKATEPSPEVIDRGNWFRKEMVRRTLRRVAPSLAELDGPDDDDIPMWVVDKFEQADFDALAVYALRDTPLPAGSPA